MQCSSTDTIAGVRERKEEMIRRRTGEREGEEDTVLLRVWGTKKYGWLTWKLLLFLTIVRREKQFEQRCG